MGWFDNSVGNVKKSVEETKEGNYGQAFKDLAKAGSISNQVTGGAVGKYHDSLIDGAVANNPYSKTPVQQVSAPDPATVQLITPPQQPKGLIAPKIATPATFPNTQVSMTGLGSAPQINMENNPFASAQQQVVNQLSQLASGQGPSIAENQLRSGQEANIAAANAAVNSARGGASPALARAAMQNAADINGKLAQDAANARLQEQLAAAGQLGTLSTQARGQDIDIAKVNADLEQQRNLEQYKGQIQQAISQGQITSQEAIAQLDANVKTAMANGNLQSAFQELQAKYAAMGLDAAKANQAAQLELQQIQLKADTANQEANYQAAADQKKAAGGLLGGIGQGIASMFSDQTLKTDIKDGKKDVREFLDAVKPYTYKYKNADHGKGTFTSPMAQDLEKTKLGKSMVEDTPQGKMVNYGRGLGTILAAISDLHDRLKKTEKK